MKTLREISEGWAPALQQGQEPPTWMLGDFLDDFRLRAKDDRERSTLVADEPLWVVGEQHEATNAFWAAIAESLCLEFGLPIPAWTRYSQCFLRRPWFAGGLESLKAILLVESPVPFRRRNLFVSANALARV